MQTIYQSKEGNKSKASIYFASSIAIFVLQLWFLPSLTRYWALFLLISILMYLFVKKYIHVNLNFTTLSAYTFIFVNLLGVSNNHSNTFDAMQFVFSFGLYFLCYLLLVTDERWINYFVKILTIICLFFVAGSILQIFNSDLVLSINRLHLSDELFSQSYVFYKNGALNGFTHQTGVNGYIISTLMIIIFGLIYLAKEKKIKLFYTSIYIFLYYLLFLTQKRGFILINFVIVIYLILKLSKSKLKFKSIFFIVLFIFFFGLLLFNTESGKALIYRSLAQEDITTGRTDVALLMWNDFVEKPLFGHGTYNTLNEVNTYNGHNIYLQVLRETGLFGFISLVGLFIYNFCKTDILLKKFKTVEISRFYLTISLYGQLLFIIYGFIGNPLYDNYPLILYFISIAITEAHVRNQTTIQIAK